jgi:hypothetical protein
VIVMGIDPGANGAAAIFILGSGIEAISFKDKSWPEIVEKIQYFNAYVIDYTFIEAVSAMPKDGAHNAFTFGENTGIIKGILHCLDIRFNEVYSQKWQRHFGLGAKFESKTARKNAQKAKAQELFPQIKVTHNIADCLLIAKYGYDIMSSNS